MMVERVARAISASSSWGNYIYAFERDTLFDERAELLKVARAAIEALREPDAKIIAKCRADWPTFNGVIFKDYWTRYLDAALSEGDTP